MPDTESRNRKSFSCHDDYQILTTKFSFFLTIKTQLDKYWFTSFSIILMLKSKRTD